MNDELEVRLRDAFRTGSLPAAPARLHDHLDEVTSVPVAGSAARDRGGRRRGRPWGALAVAAVLLIGGAVAFSIGSRGPSPLPNVAPSTQPSEATPSGATSLVYAPQWTAAVPRSAAVLADLVSISQQRVDATGIVGGHVTSDDQGRLVVEVPAGIDADPIRRLIGPTGLVAFVPVTDIVERSTHLDPAAFPPLLDSGEIGGASVLDDQNGQPTLQIILSGTGGETFGAYTAAHVGSWFALTLDEIVLAAPVINTAIPDGLVQISFAPDAADRTELARLAALIKFGPLPVALVEVANGPAPSGPIASASPVAADPQIRCGPPVDVAGLQLECEPAARAAVALLPTGHPEIKQISVRHGCPEAPGTIIDCATQVFGIVTIDFTDATPAVRILVDVDLKASYLPGSVAPGASAETLRLNLNTDDFGCDTIRTAYRSALIQIDPSAADPVTALADTGVSLRTLWSATFHGGTTTPPVVIDARGVTVANHGTRIELPEQGFPTLAGYFVCPSADAIRVFDRAPS
jgi:hypothetical protein